MNAFIFVLSMIPVIAICGTYLYIISKHIKDRPYDKTPDPPPIDYAGW